MADNFISISCSGNCNFQYLTGLSMYEHADMLPALKDALTQPVYRDAWGKKPAKVSEPVYRGPRGGMYLFAQGSEDRVSVKPYGPNFKTLIEQYKLGQVTQLPPVPNPLHGDRPGILFVWIVDRDACVKWWQENVLKPWREQNKGSSSDGTR